eukprot:2763058-Pyramimonas_sp.AAC.1
MTDLMLKEKIQRITSPYKADTTSIHYYYYNYYYFTRSHWRDFRFKVNVDPFDDVVKNVRSVRASCAGTHSYWDFAIGRWMRYIAIEGV